MTEAWSLTQRQYLEAMGFQLLTSGESASSSAARPLLHEVEKVLLKEADVAAPRLSPQLKTYLAKAAKVSYEDLAQRVFLPADLATNPHAKRAFWHILKGIRRS